MTVDAPSFMASLVRACAQCERDAGAPPTHIHLPRPVYAHLLATGHLITRGSTLMWMSVEADPRLTDTVLLALQRPDGEFDDLSFVWAIPGERP